MLQKEEFKEYGQHVIDWIDHYFKILKDLPVKSQVQPKEIYEKIPSKIPLEGADIEAILKDTTDLLLPGITHWQHPNFHAYFPANSSIESVYAEMITAAIGAQCMIWDTSPAAAELEERMMEWMRDAMGLPESWEGVIQDTASTATLVAIICARERSTNFKSNEEGVPGGLQIYCSAQTHSSIEKAATVAGIGRKNVLKIGLTEKYQLDTSQLIEQIKQDKASGLTPCCVVASIGTTGTVAIDSLEEIAKVCTDHGIWLHVDAAYAGSALFLPEYHWMIDGIENADSFVFNPHKWLFTNFDCTAYYVKDANHLIRTFEILPEYLKTTTRGLVNDYRDWGIPLGRRFRALKLWFVMRSYGLSGIQQKLRHHIELIQYFAKRIAEHPNYEIVVDPVLNFTCIRWIPQSKEMAHDEIDKVNQQLIRDINESGKAYLSHTTYQGKYVIRIVIGQTYVQRDDVDRLIDVLEKYALLHLGNLLK